MSVWYGRSPVLRKGIFLNVLSSLRTGIRGRGVDLLPIGFAVRSYLRSRLTLRGRAFRRNPLTSGAPDLPRRFRYSSRHSHSYGYPGEPKIKGGATTEGYYALFKGLLLLSEPPDCLCGLTSLSLSVKCPKVERSPTANQRTLFLGILCVGS